MSESSKPNGPAWSWCCHDFAARPAGLLPGLALVTRSGRPDQRGDLLSTWHKLVGPWSRYTFCREDSRRMAPRKWLRTTDGLDRPAQITAPDVQPFGVFCPTCQEVSLHRLVPPDFPKWREPVDCLVMADWWEERGDDRAQTLRCMALPEWSPPLDGDAVVFGPWGEVRERLHLWRRERERSWPPAGAAGRRRSTWPAARPSTSRYRAVCGARSVTAWSVAWCYDAPGVSGAIPCQRCLNVAQARDVLAAKLPGHYAPFNPRPVTPPDR